MMNLFFPDPGSFAAICADVDVLTAHEDLAAEFDILLIVPDLPERFPFEVTQRMLGVLVETAGHYQTIPGDHGRMPKPPAVVFQGILNDIFPAFVFPVTAVSFVRRDEPVRVVLVIVHLGRLEPDLVYAGLLRQSLYIL